MGIVLQEVTFDGPAPTAAMIAARMTERVGLPVIVRESPAAAAAAAAVDRGGLYDLAAWIAFEMYPKAEIELTAYRAGAVKEHLRRCGMDALPIANVVQGVNEAAGTQTVYVQGYVGQEPTLLLATTLALESLGGRLGEPMSDELRREFGRVVSGDELRRRHRKVGRQGLMALAGGVLLLPVLVPVWTVEMAWQVGMLLRRLRKARRRVKKHLSGQAAGGA
jgi:hypothetical protein